MHSNQRLKPMTHFNQLNPSNGIHSADLHALQRLMFWYGTDVTLRAMAAICDDRAVSMAPSHASAAKRWLAIALHIDTAADRIEEGSAHAD